MFWLSRITAVMLKEFRQLSRDRLTFGMVVMLPLIQLLLFGYAINNNIRNVQVGIVDLANSSASRNIVATMQATQVVAPVAAFTSVQAAEQAIRVGDIRAALVLPADLEQRLSQTDRPLGQWIVDASDNVVSSALLNLRDMPLNDLQRNYFDTMRAPRFETVLYYNPERRTPVNIVPGMLAVMLTMTMILFTSIAIVREKERGNIELLITTPVRSIELMLGKIIPYMLIGLLQASIILSLGYLVFAVPINGAPLQIFCATLLFIMASLVLGLIISTVAKAQLQAMQMTVFFLLPSILLSGFLFPYEGMPVPAQYIAETLPATHFVRMIRAIVLRDATLSDLAGDSLFLIVFSVVGLMIATLKFRKRLD